ncbi:MAG: hypothetical protein J4F36_13280 [Nitrosopumilaceae archaeon]|nr:hypothetical protein [Nitrosopumilaceae archaeon]
MSFSEKIYPSLEPTAPQPDEQVYKIKKIEGLEQFLRDEIKERNHLSKKLKRYATTTKIVDHTLIGTAVLFGSGAITAVSTGIGTPISIALGGISLVLSLATLSTHKTLKILNSKLKKHDEIKVLAESKLDSISTSISQAIQDSHISQQEFERIFKEIDHYRNMKEEIREKTKRHINTITNEQRQAILNEGKKQGKEDFLRQIASTSNTQPVNAT